MNPVSVIQAVYGLPAICVGYMDLLYICVEIRNSTYTLPITRQLWIVFLQSGSFKSVSSVFLCFSVG